MLESVPFYLFAFITIFHVYLGFGAPIQTRYILPIIQGQPLPFHSLMALPVAGLLLISTIAFGYEIGFVNNTFLGNYNQIWLALTSGALIFRGLFGFIFFHLLNKIIDDTEFKTWDLRVYSPLCMYLGVSSFLALT